MPRGGLLSMGVLLVLLSGCASEPRVRPIMAVETRDPQSGQATTTALTPRAVASVPSPAVAGVDDAVPRIDCRATLSREDDLLRAVIEQRIRDGSYFAALAQIQALPAENARIAILRADVLRRLGMPQAEAWYKALQGGCMAGQAEHGLGLLAAQRGDYPQALKYLAKAASLVPSDARVRNDLGYIRIQMAQDAQAEFELRTAAELAPDDRLPLFNLALLALVRGDVPSWVSWSSQLHPDDKDLAELSRTCVQMVRARQGGAEAGCPVNLSRFSMPAPAP